MVFPAELETLNVGAFIKCKALNTIKISSDSANYVCKNGMLLTKDKKTLVWVQPKVDKISIPSGVTTVAEAATRYSYVKKISIPASVTSIKNCAFNGNSITSITVSSKNTRYGKSNNCIYSKKTKRLVVAISKNGTITLPKQVKYMTSNVSIAGKAIKKITIPATFAGFKENWFSNGKYNVTSMKVYFKSTTPPAAEKGSFCPFATYYVPKKKLSTYKKWYYNTEELTEAEQAYTTIKGY